MKRTINTLSTIALLLTGAFFVVFSVIVRFANPDMSETRLLLAHWEEYRIGVVLFLVSGFLMEVTRNRK